MPEWIDPKTDNEINRVKAHLFRYRYATKLIRPTDVVVDAACGAGYGSAIMANKCSAVIGLDKNFEALSRAVQEYFLPGKTSFVFWDLESDKSLPHCDVAVSFETIEHLEEPQRFANLLMASAKRLIILSTPNIADGSQWHKHTHFSEEEITTFFRDNLWTLRKSIRQREGPYSIYVFLRSKQ